MGRLSGPFILWDMMKSSAKSRRPGNPFIRQIKRVFLITLLICASLPWIIVLIFRFVNPPFSAYMAECWLSAKIEGKSSYELRQSWIPIKEISQNLVIAVITSEDENFIWHYGFDFDAIEKAFHHNANAKKVAGASTISQQVAKNLFLWPSRNWLRKGVEAYFTVAMEVLWPKRRILEMYLNFAQMGDGIFGAEAASRIWFHKSASHLSSSESASLAAILPSPVKWHVNAPNGHVQRDEEWILDHMGDIRDMGYYQMIMGTRAVCKEPK